VVLLDVSPSMHPYLHIASKCIATMVQRKLMQSKNDELGIIYFGATETDNELNTELGGYKNIVVAQPIAVVSEGLTSCLDSVPHGSGESDCILCCDGYT